MLVFASIALAFAAHPSSYQPLTFFTAPCIGQGISLDFAGEDGRWTYHNLTVGLADIAPTMVAQRDEGAGTYYRLIKSSTMLEGYLHGYEKYGWDYNPDQLAFSSTVNEGEMNPAMITLLAQGEGDDAATQLMAFQFYGLERGQAAGTFKFTLRTYPTFDDSQFEPHRTAHSVYDKHQPHFHTLPEAGKTAIVAPPRASATWTTCSLEIYLTPFIDSALVAAVVEGVSEGAADVAADSVADAAGDSAAEAGEDEGAANVARPNDDRIPAPSATNEEGE